MTKYDIVLVIYLKARKGERGVYYELSKKEIKQFAKQYLPMWENDIVKVTRISYKGVTEYMVNDHYLIILYKNKVIGKDLQEL